MDKMKMESPNLTVANIEKIAALFPNCITETADENGKLKKAINFDMLRAMLSEDVAEGDEAYEFTWVGKKAAIAEANRPIRKTLRPVINDETVPTGKDSDGNPYCSSGSVNWDTTENLYIEGDNLKVLKLLQESYLNSIKIIYIVIWTNIMISTLGIYKCLNTFFCFESHGYSHRFIERVSRPLACISALTPSR
ncbi:hypothetical protein [Ruminococcus albus]|uniref:Adenine-specific DNA-methyltransferase n=1 Tax=Ruminococcus albus TaxID=1264 RepID=A0A1H7P9I5_RUMAL|nr:hypothetical protein [Ruminococcus albus]SEL32431.1 adenine-specific DNA-methyltransferase [Ruminococcus albus]